jgi:hypothetical protein
MKIHDIGFVVSLFADFYSQAHIHPEDYGMKWPKNEFFATELARVAFLNLSYQALYDTVAIVTEDEIAWMIHISDVLEPEEIRLSAVRQYEHLFRS